MLIRVPNSARAQALFTHFCEGYQRRDLPFLLDLFTEDAILWGTALDEERQGLKEIEAQFLRDWSQSERGIITILSMAPSPENALWAAGICQAQITINGTLHTFGPLRGTITIGENAGRWKITHMHASFPDMRTLENNSFPLIHDKQNPIELR